MPYFFIKNLLFIGLAGLFFKKKMVKTGDIIHIYLFFRKILFFINIDTAIVSVCFPVLQLKFNRLSFSEKHAKVSLLSATKAWLWICFAALNFCQLSSGMTTIETMAMMIPGSEGLGISFSISFFREWKRT